MPDPASASLAAIILSGGRSSRMGRDKASLVLDGRTLLARTVDAARRAGATQIVVAGEEADLPDVTFVREEPPRAGPVPALDAALAVVEADRVLVLPCDLAQPVPAARELVRADVAQRGTAQRNRGPDGVVAVDATGRRQHLTVLVGTSALRRHFSPGTTRVRERVAGLDLAPVPEPADRPGLWDDMDTPEDYDRLRSGSAPDAGH